MKIPEKIKVGGITYKVVYTHEPDETNTGADGAFVECKQEIRLKPGLGKEYTEQVFMHEVVHAISCQACVDFGENDEVTTEAIARTLYQIIKDNNFE